MGFLDDIVNDVQAAIDAGYYDRIVPRYNRSLKAAVAAKKGKAVIAELKPASPSAGKLRKIVQPLQLGRAFVSAGAVGVSVLTERKHFGGELDVAGLDFRAPVLMKDFVISEKQLGVAGDCVLLIQELLDRLGLDAGRFIHEAHSRGQEVLLEAHGLEAFKAALASDADLVGLNNRNLDSLELDPMHAQRVLAKTGTMGKLVVVESGLSHKEDVARAFASGGSAVLIGTSLMRATDPVAKLKELLP